MAQKVQVLLLDDLDGSEASETVTFGLDGRTFEIDLNSKHATALRKSMAQYVDAGRKVGNGKRKNKNGTRVELPAPAREVRDWARSQGMEVGDKGAIPASVREAFAEAH